MGSAVQSDSLVMDVVTPGQSIVDMKTYVANILCG